MPRSPLNVPCCREIKRGLSSDLVHVAAIVELQKLGYRTTLVRRSVIAQNEIIQSEPWTLLAGMCWYTVVKNIVPGIRARLWAAHDDGAPTDAVDEDTAREVYEKLETPRTQAFEEAVCRAKAEGYRKLWFGRKDDIGRHICRFQAIPIVGPFLRKIQRAIDERMTMTRNVGSEDADLAVRNLACRTRVLPRHSARRFALFEKAGLVDHQHCIVIRSMLDDIVAHDIA